MLTAIGGLNNSKHSNDVYSLKERGILWFNKFPPMPTKRSSATALCAKSSLIVIGGELGESFVRCPVEIMSTISHQWFIVPDIPFADNVSVKGLVCASGVVHGDQIYVLGGLESTTIYSCSLTNLIQSCESPPESHQATPPNTPNIMWKRSDLNLPCSIHSTYVSFCGHLLAIGGQYLYNIIYNSSNKVYAYKPTTNSWEEVSQMSIARCPCFAVVLPTNELMVVGGRDSCQSVDSVEFASLT